MKKNLIITVAVALLIITNTSCNAQSRQNREGSAQKQQSLQPKGQQAPIYESNQVDEQAMFVGGDEKRMLFMLKNLKYPKDAEKERASGTVRVHFVVKADGSLSEIKVSNSIHPALDSESIRIVKAMPKWIPAKINGKTVCQKAMIAIPFRLK